MNTVNVDETLQQLTPCEDQNGGELSWEAQILKGASAAIKEKKNHVARIAALEQTITTLNRTIALQDGRITELSRLNLQLEPASGDHPSPSWTLLIVAVIGACALGAALTYALLAM